MRSVQEDSLCDVVRTGSSQSSRVHVPYNSEGSNRPLGSDIAEEADHVLEGLEHGHFFCCSYC